MSIVGGIAEAHSLQTEQGCGNNDFAANNITASVITVTDSTNSTIITPEAIDTIAVNQNDANGSSHISPANIMLLGTTAASVPRIIVSNGTAKLTEDLESTTFTSTASTTIESDSIIMGSTVSIPKIIISGPSNSTTVSSESITVQNSTKTSSTTLSPDSIITTGSVQSTSLMTTGSITASSLDVSGAVVTNSLEVKGAISASSLIATGNISSSSLDVAGSVSASSINSTGGITSSTLKVAGLITTSSFNAAGNINASTLILSSELSVPSLTVQSALSAPSLTATVGDITAKGSISGASVTSTGDIVASQGNITASGSITASGQIQGSSLVCLEDRTTPVTICPSLNSAWSISLTGNYPGPNDTPIEQLPRGTSFTNFTNKQITITLPDASSNLHIFFTFIVNTGLLNFKTVTASDSIFMNGFGSKGSTGVSVGANVGFVVAYKGGYGIMDH